MASRVAVLGASGQIGRPLCRELIRTGHTVSVFSRDPARARHLVPGATDYLAWAPGSRLTAECSGHLGAADALVYLAGGPLFDGRRHSRAEVEAESRARAGALGILAAATGGLDRRPGTLIAASSVGYYGFAGHSDELADEASPRGQDWWGADSASIEQAALAARQYGVRTVLLRTGHVLTPASLASQVAQSRRHLGGPVRARQFARTLGAVLGHRAWLPIPAPFVRMGMGAVTDILVHGQRVLPAKVSAAGYQFRFPALEAALRDIVCGEAGT